MKRQAWSLAAVVATGCLHARPVEYTGKVRVTSAELVPINHDVKVVADADEPMFFAVGSYWLFHDGAWYRSGSIHGTWFQVDKPPVPVVQIAQPYAYTRYRRNHPGEQTATIVDEQQQPQSKRNKLLSFEP